LTPFANSEVAGEVDVAVAEVEVVVEE